MLEVGLDLVWICLVRKDGKELIVGQEAEPREVATLSLEEVRQFLHDEVDVVVVCLELLDKLLIPVEEFVRVLQLIGLNHLGLEERVNFLEHSRLSRKYSLNLGGAEDVLQVHPRFLEGQHVLSHLVHRDKVFSEFFSFLLDHCLVLVATDHVDIR